MERNVEALRETVHKIGVRSGFRAAEVVIDVDDRKLEGEFRAEFEKGVEEAYRIGAAGHSHANPVAWLEETVTGDGVADLIEKGHGLV